MCIWCHSLAICRQLLVFFALNDMAAWLSQNNAFRICCVGGNFDRVGVQKLFAGQDPGGAFYEFLPDNLRSFAILYL